MMQIVYSAQPLLVDDQVAQALVEYATLVAENGLADSVTLHALDVEGAAVEATIVLDNGANLMSQTSDSTFEEPDNSEALTYLTGEIKRLKSPPHVEAAGAWAGDDYFDGFDTVS